MRLSLGALVAVIVWLFIGCGGDGSPLSEDVPGEPGIDALVGGIDGQAGEDSGSDSAVIPSGVPDFADDGYCSNDFCTCVE